LAAEIDVVDGAGGELASVLDPQLAKDGGEVGFDSALADEQVEADVAIRRTRSDQACHSELLGRQDRVHR